MAGDGKRSGRRSATGSASSSTARSEPKLQSGGNPQIPKGDGDSPGQDYVAAMAGWKHELGGRLDDLVVRTVADVHKAVKWNQPFYGCGDGWFLSFRCYTDYVQLAFL